MGGTELLRRLCQQELYAETRAILMTSSSNPHYLEECQGLKVAHYVTKPMSLAAFAKAIADTFHPPLRSGLLFWRWQGIRTTVAWVATASAG